jgi:hypothetical protein
MKIFNVLSRAAIEPAANNRESPGSKGITTRPVSVKTMANKMR